MPRIVLTCCAVLSGNPGAWANGDDDARVVDIRDLETCTAASLPNARCLPVNNFRDADGKIIDFHALRWLLGTVGLSGEETVLVIGANARDVKMVGGLLHQAGQRYVRTLDKPFEAPVGAAGGDPRSLSREEVFTRPMRDTQLN